MSPSRLVRASPSIPGRGSGRRYSHSATSTRASWRFDTSSGWRGGQASAGSEERFRSSSTSCSRRTSMSSGVTTPPTEDIVVVGGGAAGLSTAAALKRRGLAPIVLDKDERIGGTWARRYERLSLHTIRRFS